MKITDNLKNSLKKISRKKEKGPVEGDKKNSGSRGKITPPQYLTAGLGVLVMLGGAAFVLTQTTGNSGNTGLKPAQGRNAGNRTSERENQWSSNRNPGDLLSGNKSEKVVNPLTGRAMDEPREKSAPPEAETNKISVADRKTPASSNSSRTAGNPIPEKQSQAGADSEAAILGKLDSMAASVIDRLDSLSSSIDAIKNEIAENGDRIDGLAAKIERSGGGNERGCADLKAEKKILRNRVSTLEKRIRKAKSDYKWLRGEYERKKKALKSAREEKKNLEKRRLSTRSLFPGWEMAGLSNRRLILMKNRGGRVRYLKVGESFMGVKLTKIDLENEKVYTDAGTRQL